MIVILWVWRRIFLFVNYVGNLLSSGSGHRGVPFIAHATFLKSEKKFFLKHVIIILEVKIEISRNFYDESQVKNHFRDQGRLDQISTILEIRITWDAFKIY